jgi:hypothetical protein
MNNMGGLIVDDVGELVENLSNFDRLAALLLFWKILFFLQFFDIINKN